MKLDLIANTGVQFFSVPLEVDPGDRFKMFFHEWSDAGAGQLKLEAAHEFSDAGVWVSKRDLFLLGCVGKDGKISRGWDDLKDHFARSGKKPVCDANENQEPSETGCFSILVGRAAWKTFENVWIPLPYFSLDGAGRPEFGPTNWCRCKLIPSAAAGDTRKYDLLIAFDTRSAFEDEGYRDNGLSEIPVFTGNDGRAKRYALCGDENMLIEYCSYALRGGGALKNCDWVDKYMLKLFHGVDNISKFRELNPAPNPKLGYLAHYIFIIRYLRHLDMKAEPENGFHLPEVSLSPDRGVEYGDVDLVVDIGNSRTCAVLFDGGDFNRSTPLALQDFTEPVSGGALNRRRDSFDMRLAFRRADFGGNFGLVTSRQFIYPGMVRLGKEAGGLVYAAVGENSDAEKSSTFSSPKRYLWDTKLQKHEWEFVRLPGENAEAVSISGITEQMNSDGSLSLRGVGGLTKRYSRRALMTLAFLEILAQARMQINSFEQRAHWQGGDTPLSKPRRIARIIVTCPSAMSRVEQAALRRCAEDAAVMLDRFYDGTYKDQITDENAARKSVSVVPSARKLLMTDERTEWIYDEATAAQFVFLYAEIAKRYQTNAGDYFDVYGKVRADGSLKKYEGKSLTVGSVDIGAGTTDVMIAAYKYAGGTGHCTLTPVPLFWESFYEAGDDLLKELILRLVIEGNHSPIVKKIAASGRDPHDLMYRFLGTDNGVSFRNRQLRGDFNLQVSVPIVTYFLESLRQNRENRDLSFGDIFGDTPPTQRALEHFKQHFGFEFESLKWRYDAAVITDLIERSFLDRLIGKISALFSHYACDIVLLSGRPTGLGPVRDLFLRYYPVSPNRLKTMNDYRVGRWYPQDERYPFIDSDGNFINPKSMVITGAMIGYKGGSGKLDGFKLDLTELKEKMLPTTNYFGRLDRELEYAETVIKPDNKPVTLKVSSLAEPIRIGVRQLDIPAYPSRPFYTLGFNDDEIERAVKGRLGLAQKDNAEAVRLGVEAKKADILQKMPIEITIDRNVNEDIERLDIVDIIDREGNSVDRRFVSLQVQSLSEIDNFWLDSGLFDRLNLSRLRG